MRLLLKPSIYQSRPKLLYAEVIAQLFDLSRAKELEAAGSVPPEESEPAAEGETNVVRLPVTPTS